MVLSLSIPSCGGSAGWLVFRSVGGRWRQVLDVNHGAWLDPSGRRIREWQGVLAPSDAHCFPSSARTRLWHWTGARLVHGRWHSRPALPRHFPGLSQPAAA
jgi:hypothetical protein